MSPLHTRLAKQPVWPPVDLSAPNGQALNALIVILRKFWGDIQTILNSLGGDVAGPTYTFFRITPQANQDNTLTLPVHAGTLRQRITGLYVTFTAAPTTGQGTLSTITDTSAGVLWGALMNGDGAIPTPPDLDTGVLSTQGGALSIFVPAPGANIFSCIAIVEREE